MLGWIEIRRYLPQFLLFCAWLCWPLSRPAWQRDYRRDPQPSGVALSSLFMRYGYHLQFLPLGSQRRPVADCWPQDTIGFESAAQLLLSGAGRFCFGRIGQSEYLLNNAFDVLETFSSCASSPMRWQGWWEALSGSFGTAAIRSGITASHSAVQESPHRGTHSRYFRAASIPIYFIPRWEGFDSQELWYSSYSNSNCLRHLLLYFVADLTTLAALGTSLLGRSRISKTDHFLPAVAAGRQAHGWSCCRTSWSEKRWAHRNSHLAGFGLPSRFQSAPSAPQSSYSWSNLHWLCDPSDLELVAWAFGLILLNLWEYSSSILIWYLSLR